MNKSIMTVLDLGWSLLEIDNTIIRFRNNINGLVQEFSIFKTNETVDFRYNSLSYSTVVVPNKELLKAITNLLDSIGLE